MSDNSTFEERMARLAADLDEATRDYTRKLEAEREASKQRNDALNVLNKVQLVFDQVMMELRKTAPYNTAWSHDKQRKVGPAE